MQSTDPDPLAQHRSSPAELQRRFELDRSGVSYLAFRDNDDHLELRPLDADLVRIAVGRSTGLYITLAWDEDVSSVHAEIRRLGQTWVINDVGSTNGTFINERRLLDDHRLVDRDMIRVGETHLVYRSPTANEIGQPTTIRTHISTRPAPRMVSSDSRKRVLVELARPLLETDMMSATTPTNLEISQKLYIAEGTVRKHLRLVAAELKIRERHGVQRERLARELIRLGMVSRRDL